MLVDDHAIVREGLVGMLSREDDIQFVASVGSGTEAIDALVDAAPDIVLLDLRMPGLDGLATLEKLVELQPRLPVLMLSAHDGDDAIFKSLSLGARGYILKSAERHELLDAIRTAMRGRLRPSGRVARRLGERVLYKDLSERELDVLIRIAHGESNKEIAEALNIAENTVKNHVKNLMLKLNTGDRTEAVMIAVRRGILDPDRTGPKSDA
jgi:two-component system NarL family response regulator